MRPAETRPRSFMAESLRLVPHDPLKKGLSRARESGT